MVHFIYAYLKIYLDPYLELYTKINSKFIVDLNIKGKIIKPFEKNKRISPWPYSRKRFHKQDTKSTSHKRKIRLY